MTATFPITDEAQWLQRRCADVTSTEVAALYGLSPYVTHFELWHRKRDGIVEEREPNERIKWGTRLQDAIAAGLAEERGWIVRRLEVYMRDEADRLGSSFDYEALSHDPDVEAVGLAEIKNVDRGVFFDEWIDGPAGIEAPQHIELQVQTQMEVADLPWCAIVALVGGNELKVTIRERDREIGQSIRQHVRAFWKSIADGTPPTPDYTADAELLCRMHGRANKGETITADAELEAWLARYVEIDGWEAEQKALKARVFERTTASKILTTIGTFSCGTTAASETRRAFRSLRFTPTKKKP